jgi:hypothetical protein
MHQIISAARSVPVQASQEQSQALRVPARQALVK